ncbi:hypothetical protein DSO57_1035534 [Entomophthora muscae]|uniref:Uncharacterized protein n=1 Tax=Entomophthora muscae TaxID=34485 RepID=A0ACC2S1R6_9FUNG|nr:hypothetical protein DSO57_1035534 [Entomophthora muscae]
MATVDIISVNNIIVAVGTGLCESEKYGDMEKFTHLNGVDLEAHPISVECDHRCIPVNVWAIVLEPVKTSNNIVAEPSHYWSRELNLDVPHSHREGYHLMSDCYSVGVGYMYCFKSSGYLI